MNNMKEKQPRPLYVIASDIRRDWEKVHYTAKPYLEAMRHLDTINDMYMLDSARSVVLYFLSNSVTWRGDVARRIKAELRVMAKVS